MINECLMDRSLMIVQFKCTSYTHLYAIKFVGIQTEKLLSRASYAIILNTVYVLIEISNCLCQTGRLICKHPNVAARLIDDPLSIN